MPDVRLSENERTLLLAMNEHCSAEYEDFGGKVCYPFKSLARFCPTLDPSLVRRTVRSLARKGLTGFESGLMTEDGEMVGAGYGIEKAGRRLAQVIEARRAETTKIGSVEDESAVPTGCAHTSSPKGNTL